MTASDCLFLQRKIVGAHRGAADEPGGDRWEGGGLTGGWGDDVCRLRRHAPARMSRRRLRFAAAALVRSLPQRRIQRIGGRELRGLVGLEPQKSSATAGPHMKHGGTLAGE